MSRCLAACVTAIPSTSLPHSDSSVIIRREIDVIPREIDIMRREIVIIRHEMVIKRREIVITTQGICIRQEPAVEESGV